MTSPWTVSPFKMSAEISASWPTGDFSDGVLADFDLEFQVIEVFDHEEWGVVFHFVGKAAYFCVDADDGAIDRGF